MPQVPVGLGAVGFREVAQLSSSILDQFFCSSGSRPLVLEHVLNFFAGLQRGFFCSLVMLEVLNFWQVSLSSRSYDDVSAVCGGFCRRLLSRLLPVAFALATGLRRVGFDFFSKCVAWCHVTVANQFTGFACFFSKCVA